MHNMKLKPPSIPPNPDRDFLMLPGTTPAPVIQLHKKVGFRLPPAEEREALAIIRKHADEPDVDLVIPKCFRPKISKAAVRNEETGKVAWVPVRRWRGTHLNTRHRNKIPKDDRERREALRKERRMINERNCVAL